MKTLALLFVILALWLACGGCVPAARCASCPGWPCQSDADCDTGSGCSCAGTGTGPGRCVS